MTNFSNKMTLIEFQIHTASKITIFKYTVKISATKYIYGHWVASTKYDQIKESGKPANDSRVSFVLFFTSKLFVFFLPVFFLINLKPLSLVFLISHPFSQISGSNFYHCDVIMQIQSWWICDSVSWRVSPSWNTFFVKLVWVKYINDS